MQNFKFKTVEVFWLPSLTIFFLLSLSVVFCHSESSYTRSDRLVHHRPTKVSGVDNPLAFKKPSPFDVSKSPVAPFGSERTHETEKYTYIQFQRDEETGQIEGVTEFRSQIRELTKDQRPPEYEAVKSNKGQAPVPQVPDFSSSINLKTSETKHDSQVCADHYPDIKSQDVLMRAPSQLDTAPGPCSSTA